ncbi:MAG: N-succinylarginine dihydrolase, partial [Pseudomonadota bacterium]
ATVDPRFLLDAAKAETLESVITANWPEQIDPTDIGSESLEKTVVAARYALLDALDLTQLG